MGYIGKQPETGRYGKLDQISSGFNGSTPTFNLTVGTEAVYPVNPQALIISLNGVIQQPGTDFTVSAATITFTTNPASGVAFFGVILGDSLDVGTPSDGSVTFAKMAANSVNSDQYVDGSIDTVHIGNLQITNALLADDAVGADELAANAVVDASIAGNAQITFDKMENLTTSRALVTDGSGDIIVSDVTTTELEKLDGLTSTTAELNKLYGTSANVTAANLTALTGTGSTALHSHAGGAGLVFIDTAVASSSSTLEVTLTGSYETYLISGSDLDFSNDIVQINGRMGTSSAWADEYKNAYHRVRSDNVHDHAYSNSNAHMQLSSTIGNATGEGATFTVWFNKPIGVADTYPMIHGTMMAINHSHIIEAGEIHSMGISALNVARFKIFPTAGTFTSGRLTVWGLVHA